MQKTKKLYLFFIIVGSIFIFQKTFAQDSEFQEYKRGDMRIMFYNCENFFDPVRDSSINDVDFTPDGAKHWNFSRYYEKMIHISKVIAAVGQWDAPDLIGLCEIENLKVLDDLTKMTGLKKIPYKIIHFDSPDNRGIDVGLLYRKDRFTPISYQPVHVRFPFESNKPTRDLLYVKGINNSKDTFHIFVNHWPSRWGGQTETDRKRMYAAFVLKRKTDSIFRAEKAPNIIIIGDFNDYPDNNSMKKVLKTRYNLDTVKNNELYNLSYYLQFVKGEGSLKHDGMWGIIDQMIVSGNLLNPTSAIHCSKTDAHIYNAPFLSERDDTHTGVIPFRTYIGYKYHGGYSDHYPVYLDLWRKE
jgi:predicted extracellular nuclease